jgi:hypothetical protein
MEWIGVDLDGTLAVYEPGGYAKYGPAHIGPPVPLMVKRVKAWVAAGKLVKIVTARVYTDGTPARNDDAITARDAVSYWLIEHLGFPLPVTCMKDYDMIELWDDRAVGVVPNMGLRADGKD